VGAWQLRSDRFYVGVGFIIGGFIFLIAFTLGDFVHRHPDWVTCEGELVELRNQVCDDNDCSQDVVMMFPLQNGTMHKTLLLYQSGNNIWDEVPGPADAKGKKIIVGAKLKLHYDPKNPERAELIFKHYGQGWIVGSIAALVFVPAGIGILWGMMRSSLRLRRLKRLGRGYSVAIDSIRQNKDVARRAGADEPFFYPWVIQATWIHPESGKAYELESGPIWDDPREQVNVGGYVTAVVELTRRPALYAIDLAPFDEASVVKLLQLDRK
jgi:hypothetical protein